MKELKAQPEKSLVYTFDRKPNVPKPLFGPEERAAVLACDGIDYYFAASFDEAFREQSPRAFLRQLMRDFDIKTIVVGSDFRFGADAAGDVELLREEAPKYGYKLVVVKLRGDGDNKYSSTELRRLVTDGDIRKANELMDRAYFIDGTVKKGSKLGEKLGYPTANITTSKLLPAYGVYATLTKTQDGIFPSVTNVGSRPTIDDGDVVNVETHLLDHTEDLYGTPIRVYFIEKLRAEIRFQSLDELKTQIGADAKKAAGILEADDIYTRFIMC